MKNTNCMKWVCGLSAVLGLVSCDLDMPKETKSSFETMIVKKSDIELPYKFSAKMKGQNDVTVTPQVSGQLIPATLSWNWKLHKPICRQLWLRRTLPSWSTSRTRICLRRKLSAAIC